MLCQRPTVHKSGFDMEIKLKCMLSVLVEYLHVYSVFYYYKTFRLIHVPGTIDFSLEIASSLSE